MKTSGPPRADVLLVTVNEIETSAVNAAFQAFVGHPSEPVAIDERLYSRLGSVNGSEVYHAISEMGSIGLGASQQTVDRAIRALKPAAVVAVGLAFGTDETKQSIGEILVSTQLQLYEPQRVGGDVIARGDKAHGSPWLSSMLTVVSRTSWTGARVRQGLMLSGEKLIDNVEFKTALLELFPEAIGGEMEGAGVYTSCQDHKVDWIVVKAICDWAANKGEKKNERQELAAKNAAGFMLHVLQQVAIGHRSLSAKKADAAPVPSADVQDVDSEAVASTSALAIVEAVAVTPAQTLEILQGEFIDSLTDFSDKENPWIDRDIADAAEGSPGSSSAKLETPSAFAGRFRNAVIRAPREFGLTCLGKRIAYDYFRGSRDGSIVIFISMDDLEVHRRAVQDHLHKRVSALSAIGKQVAGVIVDRWSNDSRGHKLIKSLREVHPDLMIVLLQGASVGREVLASLGGDRAAVGEELYLWTLTRSRVRSLVEHHLDEHPKLSAAAVTEKIVSDIDTLGLFRTPHICLMFLRLAEQSFEESPVNRTELIDRILRFHFTRFNDVPTYARRPDLKDAEFVLGEFCSWLLTSRRERFSKHDFLRNASDYCQRRLIDTDVDVIFASMLAAGIIVRRESEFEFRFSYWVQYFCAHHMHHSPEFAANMLSERRYAAFPRMIEFYTGIDRRRVDAVERLTEDLKAMAESMLSRLGVPEDFNPLADAQWKPTTKEISSMKDEVTKDIANSSLPNAVKDALKDQSFDRSRPFHQEIAKFIEEVSLRQMWSATEGAARALRNSDHVSPEAKLELLSAIILSWTRIFQLLVLISPELARRNLVHFEGVSFTPVYIGKGDPASIPFIERWSSIVTWTPSNVVSWFADDISSRKNGSLLEAWIRRNPGTLGECLLILLAIRMRPSGWARIAEAYIQRTPKNSLYLNRVFTALRDAPATGSLFESEIEDVRKLAIAALSKHSFGVASPNLIQAAAVAKSLGIKAQPSLNDERRPGDA